MTTLNKHLTKTLFSSISVIAIGFSITSCSSDDKTTSVIQKTEAIATKALKTETISTEAMSTEKTVSQSPVSETTNENSIEDILAHGEEAHKNHCYKCHTDTVYTREDRFVKSIDALSKQVLRCKEGSDAPWFDEDSEAVVEFLNQKYYRF